MSEFKDAAYSHEHSSEFYPTIEEALASAIKMREWPEDLGTNSVFTAGSYLAEGLDAVESIRQLRACATPPDADFLIPGRDSGEWLDALTQRMTMEDWGGTPMWSSEWGELQKRVAALIDSWLMERNVFVKMISVQGGAGLIGSDDELVDIARDALALGLICHEDFAWMQAEAARRRAEEAEECHVN